MSSSVRRNEDFSDAIAYLEQQFDSTGGRRTSRDTWARRFIEIIDQHAPDGFVCRICTGEDLSNPTPDAMRWRPPADSRLVSL